MRIIGQALPAIRLIVGNNKCIDSFRQGAAGPDFCCPLRYAGQGHCIGLHEFFAARLPRQCDGLTARMTEVVAHTRILPPLVAKAVNEPEPDGGHRTPLIINKGLLYRLVPLITLTFCDSSRCDGDFAGMRINFNATDGKVLGTRRTDGAHHIGLSENQFLSALWLRLGDFLGHDLLLLKGAPSCHETKMAARRRLASSDLSATTVGAGTVCGAHVTAPKGRFSVR